MYVYYRAELSATNVSNEVIDDRLFAPKFKIRDLDKTKNNQTI